MYTEIRSVLKEEKKEYKEILKDVKWEDHFSDDMHYQSANVTVPLTEFPNSRQSFFVKLPAKVGTLHRHSDSPGNSYIIPIRTNKNRISYWYLDGDTYQTRSRCLKVGKVYSADRTIEHEASNTGTTDSIHLVVKMPT